MTPRRFPAPWRVEATEGQQFVVKDANGFALAYVYARSDSALHDKYLTPAEAVVIAEAIARRAPHFSSAEVAQQRDPESDFYRGISRLGRLR